jgi:hypothetical protein
MSQNGKGDKRRPKSVDQKTWDKNWDRIFKTKPKGKNNVKRDKGSN